MKPFKKFSLLQETESITSYNTTMERDRIIEVLKPFIAFANERLRTEEKLLCKNDDIHIVYSYNNKAITIGDLKRLQSIATGLHLIGRKEIKKLLMDFCFEYKAYFHSITTLLAQETPDYENFIDEYLVELPEVKEPAVTDELICSKAHEFTKQIWKTENNSCFGNLEVKLQELIGDLLRSRLQPAQITNEEYVDKSISIDQYLNANPQIDPHEQTGDNDFSDEDMNHAITGE